MAAKGCLLTFKSKAYPTFCPKSEKISLPAHTILKIPISIHTTKIHFKVDQSHDQMLRLTIDYRNISDLHFFIGELWELWICLTPENIIIFTNSGSVLALYWSIFMLMLWLIKIVFHLYFSDFFADLFSWVTQRTMMTISHSLPVLKCKIAVLVN